MKRARFFLLFLAVLLVAPLYAQNPVIDESKQQYTRVRDNLIRAAESMPEADYNFKPTDAQQTFAERMMHVANQYRSCGAVAGQQKTIDTSKRDKASVVAALKESFAVCDAAWDSLNPQNANEMIQAGRGGQRSRLGILIGNTNHDSEMYGYMAVYMRLKNIVPPSSERRMR
jgi:hypothetical protein